MLAGDRGLAGGYNSGVLRQAEARARRPRSRQGRDYVLILVGKKARDYFRFRGYTIAASFTGFSRQPVVRGRPRTSPTKCARASRRARSTASTSSTRSSSRVGTQQRRHAPVHADRSRGRRPRRRTGPQADYEYEPEPDGILDACCRATPRRACSPRCSTRRRPSSPPGSGP